MRGDNPQTTDPTVEEMVTWLKEKDHACCVMWQHSARTKNWIMSPQEDEEFTAKELRMIRAITSVIENRSST
jgi:hypothetical protein